MLPWGDARGTSRRIANEAAERGRDDKNDPSRVLRTDTGCKFVPVISSRKIAAGQPRACVRTHPLRLYKRKSGLPAAVPGHGTDSSMMTVASP